MSKNRALPTGRTREFYLPLWRTAWRRLRRRPFQYILLLVGVALGVAMMVSIDLASSAASRAFALSTDAVTGKATHRIVGGPAGVDQTVYRDLRVETGYAPAAPVVEGYVLVPELGEQPLRLVGVDPFAEPPFRAYLQGDGTQGFTGLTPFLTQANTVIVSAPLAAEYGLELGDALTLLVTGREIPARIVGLLDPSGETNQQALSSLIFTDIGNAQQILNQPGTLSHIDLIVEDEAALAALEATLPAGVTIEAATARSNAVQQMTAAFELNLTALSLLALVVGMFLIYNTVSFSVVQRRPLFGVLRCLGVTGRQLFRLILAETAVLGFLGSLLGLGLGVLLGRGMVSLVTQTINDIYFVVNVQAVPIAATSLLKGLLLGIGAALVAAAVPALEALRTAPNSSLRRSSIESSARRVVPWLVPAWAILAGLGGFLLWLRGVNLIVGFVGLFAVLFAFALLTAPVTAGAMRLLVRPLRRVLGVLGGMAPRDIVRSLSRTSVAIAALMVAVSVIVGVSIMIGSFRVTVEQWLNDTLRADVYLAPPSLTASQLSGTLPPDVVAAVRDWPGVEMMVTAVQSEAFVPAFDRPVELAAVDGDVSNGQRAYAWLAADRDTAWDQLLAGEGIFISEPLLLKEELTLPPQPITLDTPAGPQTFPVLAVYYDYASDQGSLLIGQEPYRTLWQDEAISTVGLFAAPGRSAGELAAEIQATFSGRPEVVVTANEGVRQEALAIFDRTFAITAALRLLAVVVAFIGVLSALLSLQLERARELGVLRASGMTLRQLWQLTLLETGLMGGTAGLLALPTGFVLAWVLIYVINVRSFGWTLQLYLEPAYFIQALGIALVAALLAGIYPARRLGNMVVATALRQE
jgi:putative ABC transport system permease protein